MWFGFFLLILGLAAAGAGLAVLIFIPSTMATGSVALCATVVCGVFGVWFLTRLLRWLLRLTIGAALSPAGDLFSRLLAITVGALAVSTIPLFLWDVAIRVLADVFGRNPGYESLAQLARIDCDIASSSCVGRVVADTFATLWRFFQSLLLDLNLSRLPLLDLFWFLLAVSTASLLIAVVKNSAQKSSGQYSLATLRDAVPLAVRERMPVALLLIVAFYLGLSAMFAIPVLRGAHDIVANAKDVTERLTPSVTTVERLTKLGEGLVPIDFSDQPAAASEAAASPQGAAPISAPSANRTSARIASARIYAAIYDRQSREFKRALEGVSSRLEQLSAETVTLATSPTRTFLGQRDRDRYVTAVIDYHSATIARYEEGLYACRKALMEFREQIEQFRSAGSDTPVRISFAGFSLTASGFSDVDRTASEAVRICQTANSPDRVAPKLPPDPLEILGPFGATVRWLTATDSRAIATIVGMIGFGLLGATLSRMIRRSEKTEGALQGIETFFIVAGGVTAAFVVFLGSYAMLGDQQSEANPYIVFVTSLVGAVFSEDIWNWARKKFTPKEEIENGELPKPDARKPDATKPDATKADAAKALAEQARPKPAAKQGSEAADAARTAAGAGSPAREGSAFPDGAAAVAPGPTPKDWAPYAPR
ncbi:MAG TPA: hypothetical protein VK438_18725 [Xanthobacteraceae bacterium]|nr:hypothetical protein [Xanthobacteraceae bacterium]